MIDIAEKYTFVLDGKKYPSWLSGENIKQPGINFICFVSQKKCLNRLQNQTTG